MRERERERESEIEKREMRSFDRLNEKTSSQIEIPNGVGIEKKVGFMWSLLR